LADPTTVQVIKLKAQARLPSYAGAGAAGADLHACIDNQIDILPLGRALVPTGIALEIPAGYEGQVRPRSGLALRQGVSVLNAPGTIDADYRGELQVLLINWGTETYTVSPGERIAQLVIAPVIRAGFMETDRLSSTDRGSGGFGSTGT